jgi:hypothetical protein
MEARSADRSACALVRGPCREHNESTYPLVATVALTIVVVCTLLLLVGVAMVIASGGRTVRVPLASALAADLPVPSVPVPSLPVSSPDLARDAQVDAQISALRRYVWWANVATVAALASGILGAWAGSPPAGGQDRCLGCCFR